MTLYSYFVRGDKHAAMCATSIESVRRVDNSAHFAVMCDEATEFPWVDNIKAPVNVLRFDSYGAPIMLANLDAQCRALGHFADMAERVVFLDTDVLMLQPLPFTLEQHLIVTWRNAIGVDDDGKPVEGIARTMPYNYGVIGVRMSPEAYECFIWMRERIRRMNSQLKRWYGNQVALAALAGPPPESGERTDERRIPWLPVEHGIPVRITKLACERWNYTPQKVGERIHGTRSVLHFKGGARALMESYARKLSIPWHGLATEAAA